MNKVCSAMIHLEQYQSGHYQKSLTGYDYFIPTKINDGWTWEDPQLNLLLEKSTMTK
jgi:hypothetical protein